MSYLDELLDTEEFRSVSLADGKPARVKRLTIGEQLAVEDGGTNRRKAVLTVAYGLYHPEKDERLANPEIVEDLQKVERMKPESFLAALVGVMGINGHLEEDKGKELLEAVTGASSSSPASSATPAIVALPNSSDRAA